ncbi:hypothetical protein CEK60_03520 [Halomonas sp. N3-2A]|nr:hypothetical protein CEK60_03520 [Halomonas sp. N3-2A]
MTSHQPKASMCIACRHTFDDCSGLPFSTMPAMAKSDDAIIVRCTEFEHANRPPQRPPHSRPGSA